MFKNIQVKSSFAENKRKGIIWMLLRCLMFSFMSVSFGMISNLPGPFTVFFLTILARFIFLLPPVIFANGFNLPTKFFNTYIIRAILTTLGFAAYIAALKKITLNEVTAISYTAPLFTGLFASIILKESFTNQRVVALIAGFIGAMIIIRPDIRPLEAGTYLALSTAVLWSMGDIVVKIQANTQEKIGTQLFWSTLLMILASLPLALLELNFYNYSMPSDKDMFWIAAAGLFILLTNLCLFISCRYSDMGFLMPFSFSKLVFTAILSYFFLGEILSSSTFLGSAIIVSASIYLIKPIKKAKNN